MCIVHYYMKMSMLNVVHNVALACDAMHLPMADNVQRHIKARENAWKEVTAQVR